MTVTPGIITRNGVDIYYEVRGKGPFLILIPGAYGMSIPYEKEAECLAAEFTVITFDRRGFLRSSKPAPSTKWPDLIIETPMILPLSSDKLPETDPSSSLPLPMVPPLPLSCSVCIQV
ncbi:hypothetical protein AWENTII_010294 [Aspergillus wentii]